MRDILDHYSAAEHAAARAAVTTQHTALLDALLEGRTDLR
jgi:hypothetical protein